MRPLRVFLCHASQDKPAVRKLHRYLKQHGIEPWLDQEDLLPGENWEVEIPRALNASDVILVCLSKNSVNKEGYVQKEISFALDKALEKPEGTIFIIPAKLEDCEVPKRLNRYQWVDLFRPDSNKRLLLGLNKRALDLGSDVMPVILDDTRQRKITAKPLDQDTLDKAKRAAQEKEERETAERTQRAKDELEAQEKIKREISENAAREKLKRETVEQAEIARLAQEAKEKVERETAEKNAREKLESARKAKLEKAKHEAEREAKREKQRKFITANSRWLGVGGLLILITFIFGGFGLNYLIKNLPVSTATISPSIETPISTPTLGIGSNMVSEKDGMILVYVPDGEFTMGSNDGLLDEMPVHQVYLDAFWIDHTEVTNKQYSVCVAAGMCEAPVQTESITRSNYFGDAKFNNYPVISVDWKRAKNYCEWANRRLPTEAEWEKAARGTNGYIYPWGRKLPNSSLLNYNDEVGDTVEVGQYPDGASVYGALDMAGNVLEWVSSLYQPYPYTIYNGRENMGSLDARVLRGGSLNLGDYHVRTTYRIKSNPAISSEVIGFRCAISP
jgi:formylglycine-generating enzyme required for sulfatase activity